MRGRGSQEREDLSIWLPNNGFAGTSPGNHIAARAQEFLSEARRPSAGRLCARLLHSQMPLRPTLYCC